MMRFKKGMVYLMSFVLLICGIFFTAMGDEHKERGRLQGTNGHDNDDEHKKESRKRESHGREHLVPVNNPTYKEQCGACHFAYQPGLMPSGSWEKIIAGLDDHFGDFVDLDRDSRKIIADYLRANAADRSFSKRSAKIMESLGGQSPLRITDVPYIRRKHHEIDPAVFRRKSIGSLSNCSACHTSAEQGIYEDDDVRIPR